MPDISFDDLIPAKPQPPQPSVGFDDLVPQQPSIGTDVAKSIGSGLVTGTEYLLGLPGDMQRGMKQGGDWVAEKLFGAPDPATKSKMDELAAVAKPLPSSSDIQGVVNKTTGFTPYQPKTTPGKYANRAAEFLPGGVLTGTVGGAIRFGVLPGLASEGAGQATEGTRAEPYARLAAALAAPLAVNVARRVVTPFPTSPERQAATAVLKKEGVTDLTAGQTSGSQKLRYTESELGGHRGAAMMDRQAEQFTAAALRRVGENANRATPEVVNRAFDRIGKQFDDLAARNTLGPVDQKLADDLVGQNGVLTMYRDGGGTAPIVDKTIIDIGQRLSANGVLSGEYYKATTSRLARVARETNDSDLKIALLDIRSALDDAMERSIAASNPADLGAWREARRQYRDILVIEKAATGAGENAAMGLISPSALRNATVAQGKRAYARGQGDFAELARAGEAIMKPLPQSGTAPRTAARQILNYGPAFIGGGADMAAGGSGVAGGLFGLGAPFMLGRGVMSGPGRAYLGNNLMPKPLPRTQQDLAAILANSSLAIRPTAQ